MSTATEAPKKTEAELELEKLNAAPQADKDALEAFSRELLGEPKPKPAEPKKKETPPKPKAKTKPAAKPTPVTSPPVDHEALAEAVSRGVATAMTPKPEPKPELVDEFASLPAKEQAKVPVLKEMEALYPDRYKGLAKAYADNFKAVLEYQQAWEKENPDKEFDPDAEEHNTFYAKHGVGWDDEDFVNAAVEVRAKKLKSDLKAENNERLSAIERREQARELEPKVYLESKRAARQVFNSLGDQFKDIVAENGGVNGALAQKVITEDPLAADIIFPEVVKIERLCAESFRLHSGVTDFDKNNPDHVYLANFAATAESEIEALPKADQTNEKGQKFATAAQYAKMTESQRSKHYRLSSEDLNNLLAADLGARAKARLDGERTRLEQMAKKYGYTKGDPATSPQPEPELEKPVPVTTTGVPVESAAQRGKEHRPISPDAALAKEWLA